MTWGILGIVSRIARLVDCRKGTHVESLAEKISDFLPKYVCGFAEPTFVLVAAVATLTVVSTNEAPIDLPRSMWENFRCCCYCWCDPPRR